MINAPSHEVPLYLVLRPDVRAGAAIGQFLDDPRVRHHLFPPIWRMDAAGVDVPAAMPDVAVVARDNVDAFLEDLRRLCDASALDRLVERMWHAVGESVRDHYLGRGTLETFAAIFKVGTKSVDRTPPPRFRADRVHEFNFEIQYRLAVEDETGSALAPGQEGSLVFYPFDPANAAGRVEGGLDEGPGVVLEAFVYDHARERHTALLQSVADQVGWQVIDPLDAPRGQH